VVYLKHYAHLFITDGREGEVVPTFHISKTSDLNSASDPIPIPHCDAPNLRQDRGAQRQPVARYSYRLRWNPPNLPWSNASRRD
jgi:hypothetical protein